MSVSRQPPELLSSKGSGKGGSEVEAFVTPPLLSIKGEQGARETPLHFYDSLVESTEKEGYSHGA
jgi:hypothetical protein